MLTKSMHFFIAFFIVVKFQNLVLKSHVGSETVTFLLKNSKLGSNFALIKQNLSASIILPPKDSDLRLGRMASERLFI